MVLHPLVPKHIFYKKLRRNILIGLLIIAFSLLMGIAGYHYIEGLSWLDSYENAAMILAGMGPVDPMKSDAGKFFAGSYALFSGIIFLIVMAIILAPLVHRFLHGYLAEK